PPSTPIVGRRPAGVPPGAAAVHRPALARAEVELKGAELVYETVDGQPDGKGRLTEALYEPYALQAIHIPSAQPHPTKLVQS
ncbi:SAM-dependent methyltransferase, partial [Escherichia coli]|nr:SAM-dependent methyltransferase [Escherichia coli]